MTEVAEETGLEAWFLHEKLVFSLLAEQELTSLRQRLPDAADPRAETMRTELFERALTAYLERSAVASLIEAHSRGELHVGQLAWLDQVLSFKGMSAALEAIGRGARGTATFSASLATDKSIRVRGEYNVARLTSNTASDVLSGTKRQFVLGYVDGIAAGEIELRPVVIATRRLRPVPEIPVWYGDDPSWVTPAAIDQFAGVDFRQRLERPDLDILKGVPEEDVKIAFAEIFGEPEIPDDWGGEQFDLWTAKVSVQGRPLRAAIAFKGPAKFRPMTIATLGKTRDQIARLAQTAADLMIVQHCHHITPPVVNMLKTYANNPRNPKRYMTIDGYDTIKILRHFGRLRLRLLVALSCRPVRPTDPASSAAMFSACDAAPRGLPFPLRVSAMREVLAGSGGHGMRGQPGAAEAVSGAVISRPGIQASRAALARMPWVFADRPSLFQCPAYFRAAC